MPCPGMVLAYIVTQRVQGRLGGGGRSRGRGICFVFLVVAEPLVVDLLALLSLSWLSDALQLILALMRLILELVCLALAHSSRVLRAL